MPEAQRIERDGRTRTDDGRPILSSVARPFSTGPVRMENRTIGRMRALIVFDSTYDNTERIAWAIGAALAPQATVAVKRVEDVPVADPTTFDLLIVGGPT